MPTCSSPSCLHSWLREQAAYTVKDGNLAVPGGRDISSAVNELLSMPFALKIATRDLHPPDHVSFANSHSPPDNVPFRSNVTISNPDDPTETRTIPIWPPHCVQGTKGAELIPELSVSKIDRIVNKGRNSKVEMFSGFADVFGRHKSDAADIDLTSLLRQNSINDIFVTGLAGDYCVKCTALDAQSEGFQVFVVEEAVKSINSSDTGWGGAKRQMEDTGIRVVSLYGPEVQKIQSALNGV